MGAAGLLTMPDVLFIKTSSLGDVIHHMPALTEARRQRPDARFCWVVEEAFAPLVQIHPAVSDVIPVASRRWRGTPLAPSTWREIASFGRAVRARRYDDIIDTQGLVRSALMARFAHGRRHGYDANSIRERAASWFYDVRHRVGRNLHAIARNRMLTGLALNYAAGGAIDYGLSRKAVAETSREPYGILLHATARPEKEWTEASWIALGRALGARGSSLLLPWGTAAEHARSKRIAAALSNARAPERRPLDRMAALIAGASFVIGVDTGLIHLAAALGVPLVAIFTASDPGLTGPMGQGPIAVVGGRHKQASLSEVLDAFERLT
jgi:heptosyltransferase-1